MAQNFKVLGQSNPTAFTNTTLYTVPEATQAVISTITIANASAISNSNYSIAVRPAGQTLEAKHYITNNNVVQSGDSIGLTLGLTLGNTDVVTVYASTSNISFGIFGSEIT
jgi:hypothetical protein